MFKKEKDKFFTLGIHLKKSDEDKFQNVLFKKLNENNVNYEIVPNEKNSMFERLMIKVDINNKDILLKLEEETINEVVSLNP